MDESKHEIHSQVDAITAGTASVVNLTAGEDSSHPPPLGKAWSPFSSLWMKIHVSALPWRLEGGSLAQAGLTEPRPLLMCLENQQHSVPFHPTTSLSVHRLLPILPLLCLTSPPLNHSRSVVQLSFPVPSFPNNVTIFWTRGFWGRHWMYPTPTSPLLLVQGTRQIPTTRLWAVPSPPYPPT